MTTTEYHLRGAQKHPFLWISVFSLGIAVVLARFNGFLGARVNYLDYLSLFNAMTIAMLACVGIAIVLSIAGLWKVHFKSAPLALIGAFSSVFMLLLFLID